METIVQPTQSSQVLVITAEQLRQHWQGHRNLTRRVIEAFPEEELFGFSVGGMRSFGQLAQEIIEMSDAGIRGVATRKWPSMETGNPAQKNPSKKELLERWDEVTGIIDNYWKQIPEGRLQEHDVAFGLYEGTVYWTLLYFIDNEIHHRGQGFVYLRALGIQPPFFWDRN